MRDLSVDKFKAAVISISNLKKYLVMKLEQNIVGSLFPPGIGVLGGLNGGESCCPELKA
jgi:hypothetical protein